jgi:hypothetical protein
LEGIARIKGVIADVFPRSAVRELVPDLVNYLMMPPVELPNSA